MSGFRIPEWRFPEWRYIALDKKQRIKLESVNVEELVQSWEQKKMPPGDRLWELRRGMKIPTYIQQKQDMRTEVLDSDIPLGMLCMHPPDEAVTLLHAAKIGLDSLFVDVPESAKKFGDYLQHIDQTRPYYVYNNKGLGYTTFNYYSSEEYRTYGRVSSPKNFLGFLKSQSRFAVIDQFVSIYLKRVAQYFCGYADVTSDNVDRIISQGDLCIIKYDDQKGMHQHIDSMLRCDATVFTIGVGRDVVYDMSRALGRNKGDPVSMIRSSNPEGTMMVLDGEARYKWTHGIPYSKAPNGIKYTIHLCFFHTAELIDRIGRCEELDTDMYSIPSDTKIGAHHHSLLGLLMKLENTRINTHIPERIKRPGLPRLHPRPGWL